MHVTQNGLIFSPEKTMEPRERRQGQDEVKRLAATKALVRVAASWELGAKDLAAILGISPASVYRLQSSGRTLDLEAKEGELGLLLVRIYRSLDALVGGSDEKARLWLKTENRHLDAVPLSLLSRVEGLVRVANYLDAMRGKV